MVKDLNTETDKSVLGKRYFGISDKLIISISNSLTPLLRTLSMHLLIMSNSAASSIFALSLSLCAVTF
ncbi:hypothetical protein Hanom_Chr07g00638881 [Helianthus anomalus]